MLNEALLQYNGTIVSLCIAIYGVFNLQKGYIRQWGKSTSLLTGLLHAFALTILIVATFVNLESVTFETVNICVLFVDSMGIGFFEYMVIGLFRVEFIKSRTPKIYPRPSH